MTAKMFAYGVGFAILLMVLGALASCQECVGDASSPKTTCDPPPYDAGARDGGGQ